MIKNCTNCKYFCSNHPKCEGCNRNPEFQDNWKIDDSQVSSGNIWLISDVDGVIGKFDNFADALRAHQNYDGKSMIFEPRETDKNDT